MKQQNSNTRNRNSLSAAIALALTAATAMPTLAYAQQAAATTDAQAAPAQDTAQTPADLDMVTVTGYRYSIEKSLDQKRNANAIVEVITAEDVGKFPDKNVADALQRVPGVVITRDGGEGKNVSVRGLSSELTLTELNGNYVATAESNGDPTRSFNYTLLPSNMLSSAELFKTPEARIDEGGVGGTVILHTRRPLDMESNSGFLSFEATDSDTGGVTPQVSGQYSWHDADDRFGFLVGYTQQKRNTRTMGASTESWQWYGRDEGGTAVDVNGRPSDFNSNWWGGTGFWDQNGNYYTGFMMPTSVNLNVTEEDRVRNGAQVTLQFKPSDNLTLTANYFRFDLSQNSQTNTLKVPEWNIARYHGDGNWPGGRLLDGLVFDPSGTIVTGANYSLHPGKAYYCSEDEAAAAGLPPGGWGSDDCTVPTPQMTGSYNIEKALSQTADIGLEWHGESIDASFILGRTWAKGGPELQFSVPLKPRRQNADGSWTNGNFASAWDLSGTPTMTFSPELMQNLQNGILQVDLGSTGSSWTRNTTEQKYAQFDATWHNNDGNFLDSIQFGIKGRDGGIHRNTGNSYWVCPGTDPSDYDNRYWAGRCNTLATQFSPSFLYPMGNLAGGINANVFPAIDFPAYIAYLNSTYGAMQTREETNFVYNVDEKIYSGYLQANFRTDRLRGNLGVRIAKTKQHADSTDRVTSFNDYFFDGADGNPLACVQGDPTPAGAPADTFCGSEGYWRLHERVARPESFVVSGLDRSYTDVLPSFNIAYDLTDDLVLRAAASKVISRPSYGDIASPGALQFFSQEYVDDRRLTGGAGELGWFGSGSNKELEPYEATQYDVGVEWYFQPGSVLGLGLFRKNVSNFSVPVVQDVSMEVGGQTVTVQNYSTSAGGRDATSEGVELYAQHTLDFGLGFQFNYTYNRTNEAAIVLQDGTQIGESPLVGSAKNQTNFTVFYETQRFLARASYNRRGEVVEGLINGVNLFVEPYQQVDLNLAYSLTDQLALTASVLNLTEEESRSHIGNDTEDRFFSNGYAGRTMYLGVTYKF